MTVVQKLSRSPFAMKDAARGEVTAVLATLAPDVPDLDGDVYFRGAVAPGPVVLSAWNHDAAGHALPVGKGRVTPTGDELRFDGEFFMGTERGRVAFETLRHLGELAEWSWSLDVIDSEMGTVAGRPVRVIKRAVAWEASPVLKGAGVGTRTVSAKDTAGLAEWLRFIKQALPPAVDVRAQVVGERRRFAALAMRGTRDMVDVTAGGER